MRKLFIILFLFIGLVVQSQTVYYIDTGGSDDTGNGSSGNPWLTLQYACTQVTTATDTIHVNTGTFPETIQSLLSVGVSIVGDGDALSIITSNITGTHNWTIQLSSAEGTDGSQLIRDIKMDGLSETAWGAIGIYGRSNIDIFHCTFVDFDGRGVMFNGGTGYLENPPGTYATGNTFHHNIVTNCAEYMFGTDVGYPNLAISGQSGVLIHDNTITATGRAVGYNGYPIGFYGDGFNKAIKIYDNTLVASPIVASAPGINYMFAIELWESSEGSEIYNNDIQGCIDLPINSKGSAEFSWKIYGNYIGWENLMPDTKYGEVGIHFEGESSDIYVYNNHFENLATGVYFTTPTATSAENVYIYYNLFENLGTTGTTYEGIGRGIDIDPGVSNVTFDNWNIWNNVFKGQVSGVDTYFGIGVPQGITTNISIRNNVVQAFDYAAVWVGNSPYEVDIISIENNDFFGNGYNNAPRGTAALTNYTYQNNLTSDPEFVGGSPFDFRLQATSDNIDAGIGVGLTLDYEGNAIDDNPDIGAYEYDSGPPGGDLPIVVTTSPTYSNVREVSSGGNVTDAGSSAVSARGICWDTSSNPTTSDSKTTRTPTFINHHF